MKKTLESIAILTLISLLFYFSNNNNQSNTFEKDKATILKMCGCYKVTFNYTETFVFSEDSNYVSSPDMNETIYEWIDLTEVNSNKIVLQHILQTSPDTSAFVIKHWRQDWEYEDVNLFAYDFNNKWLNRNFKKRDVKENGVKKYFK